MQNILQRKEEKATQLHKLNGYDHKLEMAIKGTANRVMKLARLYSDVSDNDALRSQTQKIADLKALRSPEYIRELEYQKFGCSV